jgi:VCBS repeat-containing protein
VATSEKDFKVKNGLFVNQGGYFGGTVTVATPISGSDATTKDYVDSLVSTPTLPVDDTAPASPENGDLWLDTITERVHVYYNGSWIAIATLEDAETLQDHIHDTAIDGTGQVVSIFVDAGYYNDPGVLVNAGFYNTASWDQTWSGGIAIDNFN